MTRDVIVRSACAAELATYAAIPIRFTVRSVLQVTELSGGLQGLALREVPVDAPWVKDYDAEQSDGGSGPECWADRFDLTAWGFLLAYAGDRAVGGAALVHRDRAVHMLDGRTDLAILWDLRVHPDWRGRGIGRALFGAAAEWARERGCRQLKVETQNINVPACRFYARQGCRLGAIHRYAYRAHPAVADEVMLLWYLDLREPCVPVNDGEPS